MGHPRVDAIAQEAREAVAAAQSSAELEQVRVRFLGRQGVLTQLLRSLGTLAPEERPRVGAAANAAKRELEALLDARLPRALEAERRASRARERLDLTLPGRRPPRGALHPLTRVHDEIVAIFAGLGFSVVEGPEVETDYFNFEALNIPRDHPARDMQDTFYLSESTLLRTHTSPVQIRAMRTRKPPVRIIVPGKVFRRDVADMSHSPMFHQVEGLAVDRARRRGGCALLGLRRRGLPALQAGRVARDPGLGHGAPACSEECGLRSRAGHGLGVRDGDRADRDAQVRHRRPAALLRQRPALPETVRMTMLTRRVLAGRSHAAPFSGHPRSVPAPRPSPIARRVLAGRSHAAPFSGHPRSVPAPRHPLP